MLETLINRKRKISYPRSIPRAFRNFQEAPKSTRNFQILLKVLILKKKFLNISNLYKIFQKLPKTFTVIYRRLILKRDFIKQYTMLQKYIIGIASTIKCSRRFKTKFKTTKNMQKIADIFVCPRTSKMFKNLSNGDWQKFLKASREFWKPSESF